MCPAFLRLALGATPAAAPPRAQRITVRELRQLRWIVGDWRGEGTQGTTQAPFFERYRFADDSTLLVESSADSTWSRSTETSRFALRGGRFGNEGTGALWVATTLDSVSVRFLPVAHARNSFTWGRQANIGATLEWTAVIETPVAGHDLPRRRHYLMRRVR
jgi:hypothetical protein